MSLHRCFSLLALLGTILIATPGCSTPNTLSSVAHKESVLAAAGFRVIPATTPDQLNLIQTLPTGKVTRVNRQGTDYYVFPDRTQKQLYVGKLDQYQDYQRRRDIERNAALDNQAEQESLQEARTDSMVQWNNAWGSWTGD